MTAKVTNTSDISLALAVWLLHDEYDHVEGVENYISATTLMKPLKQIVLRPRLDPSTDPEDVQDFTSRALGKAIHDSIEKAWVKGYARSLKLLGYPQQVIDRIRINPSDEEVRSSNSIIPIYLEQRAFRSTGGFTIGGKFDLVTEGIVQDAKSTSAFSWVAGTKDDDYRLQMSIYRWIDAGQPVRRITEDYGRVNFIFTDWQKSQAKSNPKYPQKRVESKEIRLLSLKETQDWIEHKLSTIRRYWNTSEVELPDCTDEELWRSDPVHKYYADPQKTQGRSTRNFDSLAEANAFRAEKGKGVVLTVPGEPKRCGYCEAFSICSQRQRYFPT